MSFRRVRRSLILHFDVTRTILNQLVSNYNHPLTKEREKARMRMHWTPVSAAFIALSLVGTALPARADMVVISRDTTTSATSDCFDTSDPTCFVNDLGVLVGQRSDHYTGTGNYDKVVQFNAALASETSTISSTHVLVSQAARGGAGNLFSVGEASFVMTFSLDAPEKYE